MKVNVATRVIGGFSIVTLLLLLLGFSSYLTNLSLKDSSTMMQTLSLPALKSTTHLAERLNEQQRQVLTAYYAKTSTKMPEFRRAFEQDSAKFTHEIKNITELAAEQPELLAQISTLTSSFTSFKAHSLSMFTEHQAALSQQEQLVNLKKKLENAADDASSNLLDVIELESSPTQDTQRSAASAGAIDTSLGNIITTIGDLVGNEDGSKHELIAKELSYIVSETKNKLEYINRHGEGIVASDTQSAINEDIANLLRLVEGPDSMVLIKASQLQHTQASLSELGLIEGAVKTINADMTQLTDSIEQVASQMSHETLAQIDAASLRTLVLVLCAIVVAIIISVAVVAPLKRSLNQVNNALTVLASGNLTHKLDDSGQDEFAELAGNCNRLVDSLRGLIIGILDRSNQLAAAAEQTFAITAQTTSGIQEQKSQV
ncbi:MAG: MCP four helix bundle domain-containing protein, partial [Shewanella sp.]